MRRETLAGLGILLASGCATAPVVVEPPPAAMVGTTGNLCEKPYVLTQDCSASVGAKRLIRVSGTEVKIAGSGDGRVVLVMDAHPLLDAALSGATWFIKDSESQDSKYSLPEVRALLEKNGVHVIKTIPLQTTGSVDGYFLELDQDGYSILKALPD